MEKTSVRYTVFVSISGVERDYLPTKATITSCSVPSSRLLIEYGLCQGKPLRLVFGRVRKFHFRCCDCSKTPKGLIVVAFRWSLVRRHVIVALSNLKPTYQMIIKAIYSSACVTKALYRVSPDNHQYCIMAFDKLYIRWKYIPRCSAHPPEPILNVERSRSSTGQVSSIKCQQVFDGELWGGD